MEKQERSPYDRTKELVQENLGVPLESTGLRTEQQYADYVGSRTPAEAVMHIAEKFNLTFIE